MTAKPAESDRYGPVPVDLRNPALAAVWAWLWPGAGHLYQRRYAKAVLYMVCILSTYFFGLALGNGRVVYASFKKPDFRYAYLCQVGVGIPALPALVQYQRVQSGKEGFLGLELMKPPEDVKEQFPDELASWHEELRGFFELGTLYTMIAGLLNVLAVYDAYAGPVFPAPEQKKKRPPPNKDKDSEAEDRDAELPEGNAPSSKRVERAQSK